MARIEPVPIDSLRTREDAYTALMLHTLEQVADRGAAMVSADVITAAVISVPEGPDEPIPPPADTGAAVEEISVIPALWTAQVSAVLIPDLSVIYKDAAGEVLSQLVEGFMDIPFLPPVSDLFAEERLQGAHNRLVGIGDMLWEAARAELLAGFAAGESIEQLRERVRAAVGVTAGRAERIARTEVIAASNAGSIDQVRFAGLTGTKEWLDTPDARTRCTHRAAGGQTVAVSDQFVLGGVESGCPDVGASYADYPGDPSLPAAEAVNCRCSMAFDLDVEALVAALQPSDNVNVQQSAGGGRMPWHIVEDSAQCPTSRPYAVVKDETGKIEGCHASRSMATAHLDALYAAEQEAAAMRCPEGQHKMPDGTCMPDEEMPSYSANVQRWEGSLVVEGIETGDGRMFSPASLTWRDLPIPLMWQKVTSHGGIDDVTVNVGAIDEIWRDGNTIWARGRIDMADPDGRTVAHKMREGYIRGVSIDADSIKDADVEYIWPDMPDDPADAGLMELFAPPELSIYHKGRISAATVVNIPAFAEAKLFLIDADTGALVAAGAAHSFAAVRSHDTATTDEPWDIGTEEKRLDSPMPVATGRNFYAWIDDGEVSDGQMPKSAGKFGHHMVSADGTPGAANTVACSAGIGALHGARTAPDIPDADRRAVYDHLAAHMREAGLEPPAFGTCDVVTASTSYTIEIPDLPPADWFEEPDDLPPIGAVWVTAQGRVFGLVGPGDTAHRSFRDRRVTIPMGNVDYTRWMNRPTIVQGGQRVATGVITMNCGHASPLGPIDPGERMRHYDNSCSIAAVVAVGESKRHGAPWISGVLMPMDADQVQRFMACQLSGDWAPHREKPGWKEFCAALAVPVPGFARATKVRIVDDALVSSAVPIRSWDEYQTSRAAVAQALEDGAVLALNDRQREQLDRLRTKFGLTPKAKLSAIADRIRTSVGTAPRPAPVPGTFEGGKQSGCAPCSTRTAADRILTRVRSLQVSDGRGAAPPDTVFHLPGKHRQQDHADGAGGGAGRGMPKDVVSIPFDSLPGDVSVGAPTGDDGEVTLNVGGRSSRLTTWDVKDLRSLIIDAQYGDEDAAGSDGVYRLSRPTRLNEKGQVESDYLVSLRPVPGAWITETGKRLSDADDAPENEEVYPAEFDLMVDEDIGADFDGQPMSRVKLKDIDPFNRKGIFDALERSGAARRVDTGNGPTDVFSPRPGRVGLRMKDDDGNATDVEFNRKSYNLVRSAMEDVLYGEDEGVSDLTVERDETKTIHTAEAGRVDVRFSGRQNESGEWEGSLTIFPADEPWSVAVDGPHIGDFWDVFGRNGEVAGF